MNDRDPTPPDLAALFEREARTYGHYEEGKSAAYARVLERAALVAPLFAAAQPLASGAREAANAAAAQASAKAVAAKSAVAVGLKMAAMSVAAITAGVAIGRATAPTAHAPTVSAQAVASLVTPAASASATALASPEPRVEPPTLSPRSLPNAPALSVIGEGAGGKPPTVERGSLSKERELIEAARTALARGRPADALAFAERHALDHARGQLSEEREVLAITALESLGRREEARARRVRFTRAFPDSVLLPQVGEGAQ
jgi:hypothetical protein